MTTPIDAILPVSPFQEDNGELTSPARADLAVVSKEQNAALQAAIPATVFGIDLYENNAAAELSDPVVSFAILKAWEYREDYQFAARFPLAKKNGKLRGAYLFGHPSLSASATAASFTTALKNAGWTKADTVWLDHEVTDGKTPSYCASWAKDICGLIDADLGLPANTTGVYTYTNFIQVGNCAGLGSKPLWFAHPQAAGTIPSLNLGPWGTKVPDLIQYNVTSIDWDFSTRALSALNSWWKRASVVTPPKPVEQFGKVVSITTQGVANVHSLDGGKTWLYPTPAPVPNNSTHMVQKGGVVSFTTGGIAHVNTTDGGYTWKYAA